MKKRNFVALLMAFLMMSSSMSVLAAEATEPAMQPSDDVIVIDVTDDGMQLDDDVEATPFSATRGYTCIHASGSAGRAYINTSGGSSSSGYMQVAVREYTGNPSVNVVLYRPDGSYAGQIYLYASDGTKSIRFNTANSGRYEVAWGLASGYTCDVDVWLSW